MKSIRYFIAQTKYNIKNAHALSKSFWIGVISMLINNTTFFVIWLLFMHATGPINGWTSLDVFGMLGVALICFGVTHAFFYGITEIPRFVTAGTFDGVLLAPVNSFIKVSGLSFSVTAFGDLIQGFIVVTIYGVLSKFTLGFWLMFIATIILGCITFLLIRRLTSLVAFFMHDSSVVSRQLFEIFLRPGLYPGSIFPGKLKLFFMTVIPTLVTSALPIDAMKSSSLIWLALSFGIMFIWLGITYVVFKVSVRRYESGNFLR